MMQEFGPECVWQELFLFCVMRERGELVFRH